MGPKSVTIVLARRWNHAEQTISTATGRHGEKPAGPGGKDGKHRSAALRKPEEEGTRDPPQGFWGSSAVPAPAAWPLRGSKCGFKLPNLCSFAAARTGDWPSWPFNSQACQVTGISVQGSSRYLGAPISKVHQERASSPHRAWCAESSPGEQLPSRPFSGHPSPLSILGTECTGSEPPGDSPGAWGCSVAAGQTTQQNVGAPRAVLPLCRNVRPPARGRASAGPV